MIGRSLLALFLFGLLSCSRSALQSGVALNIPELKGFKGQVVFMSAFYGSETGLIGFIEQGKVKALLSAYKDSRLKWSESENKLYVIQKMGSDSIFTVDLNEGVRTLEKSFLRGSNLQDICPSGSGLAWITALDTSAVSLFDLQSGKLIEQKELTLEQRAGDIVSEPTYIAHSDTHFAVPFQRLSGFKVTQDALLYRWSNDGVLLPALTLQFRNPITPIKKALGKYWVGSAGVLASGAQLDGGIETLLDPDFSLGEKIIGENTLKGDIVDFEIIREDLGFAIVSDTKTWLLAFDPSQGKRIDSIKPIHASGYDFYQVHYRAQQNDLVLLDRNLQGPALRFFDFDLKEKTDESLPLPLPPVQIISIE